MEARRIKQGFLLKLFFFALVLVVFKSWFTIQPLSAGDWQFLFKENIEGFSFIPTIHSDIYFPLSLFYQSTAKILNNFGFSWPLIERIVWFWPFLVLTIFSSWHLAKTLCPKEKIIQFFVPFVYLFNTYILMVVGGGQMGVAMAYALAPLVLGMVINSYKVTKLQSDKVSKLVWLGVVLAIQIMFDPRITLITLAAAGLYTIYYIRYTIYDEGNKTKLFLSIVSSLVIPTMIALFLHSIWLLPMLKMGKVVLPVTNGELGWVGFLSFADFSDTISLLHPNWPENIFGKVSFMRPEFLLLPILAFSSLLFLKSPKAETRNQKQIQNPKPNSKPKAQNNNPNYQLPITNYSVTYFASLGLLGAFLAKGSNPPFGKIYLWLFDYLPGMALFRDPTKFYLLIVLSYSVLIPYSLSKIYEFLGRRFL